MLAEKENYLDKIKQKEIIQFETHAAFPDFLDEADKALTDILLFKKYPHLKVPLSYVLREFITNANKANLKRVYFKLNDLYINMPDDYEKGSEGFKKALREDLHTLEGYLKDYRKFVRVVFKEYADDRFIIFVANNSALTKEESENINNKIKIYLKTKQTDEPYFGDGDAGEGAGLGLYLTLQILDQIGINSSAIKIGVREGNTIARLAFKFSNVTPPPYNDFAKELLNQVDSLPKFPANIKALLSKLLDPEIAVMEVAKDVEKDPSLSADVLKLVNSAKFSLTRKIESISEAVNYLGIKGLKGILYSYGSMKVLSDRFGTIQQVWDHSYETAAIAGKLCKIKNLKKEEDAIFSAGLLHDIGKIILMSFDEEKAKNVEKACLKKGIELPVVEEVMMGLSHAVIGGKVAEHWDFPSTLIDAITHHHEPMLASMNKDVVYTVYLANHIANNKEREEINFFAMEHDVREHFELYEPQDLIELYNKVKRLMES